MIVHLMVPPLSRYSTNAGPKAPKVNVPQMSATSNADASEGPSSNLSAEYAVGFQHLPGFRLLLRRRRASEAGAGLEEQLGIVIVAAIAAENVVGADVGTGRSRCRLVICLLQYFLLQLLGRGLRRKQVRDNAGKHDGQYNGELKADFDGVVTWATKDCHCAYEEKGMKTQSVDLRLRKSWGDGRLDTGR